MVEANPARAVGSPKLEQVPAGLSRPRADRPRSFRRPRRARWRATSPTCATSRSSSCSTPRGCGCPSCAGIDRGRLDLVSPAGEGAREGKEGAHRARRRPRVARAAATTRRSATSSRRAASAREVDRAAFFLARSGKRIGARMVQTADRREVPRRRSTRTPGCRRTRSATPSRRTCSMPAPICGRCRSCSATRPSPPRRSTPTRASNGSSRCTRRRTRGHEDRSRLRLLACTDQPHMRVETVPLILGVVVALIGLGLVARRLAARADSRSRASGGDASAPSGTWAARRSSASGSGRRGCADRARHLALGTLSILIGAVLHAAGGWLNRQYLREVLLFRGPARRGEKRTTPAPARRDRRRHRDRRSGDAGASG